MFDPYHKWLGILPKDQPPHHYRLLSLEIYESDLDVIEGAADRQMGFIRQYQSGEHAALAAKLLNEIATARLCLLKPASKADYDAKLRKQLIKTEPAKDEATPFAFDSELAELASAPKKKTKQKRTAAKSQQGLVVVGGIGAVAFVVTIILLNNVSDRLSVRLLNQGSQASKTQSKVVGSNDHAPRSDTVETSKFASASSLDSPSAAKPSAETIALQPDSLKATAVDSSVIPIDGELLIFENTNSGRCLSTSKDDTIIQGPFVDAASASEYWKAVRIGDDFKLFNEASGKVLAVSAGSKTRGDQLIQYQALDIQDQLWMFIKVGDHFCIKSRWNELFVGVALSSKEANAGIVQWIWGEIPDQIWRIHRVSRTK